MAALTIEDLSRRTLSRSEIGDLADEILRRLAALHPEVAHVTARAIGLDTVTRCRRIRQGINVGGCWLDVLGDEGEQTLRLAAAFLAALPPGSREWRAGLGRG